MNEQPQLLMLFVARQPKYELLKTAGDERPVSPHENLWVVSVYPGDLHATGRTLQEADKRAKSLLDRAIGRGSNPDAWWLDAVDQMTEDQQELFRKCVSRELLRRAPKTFNAGRVSGVRYFEQREADSELPTLC